MTIAPLPVTAERDAAWRSRHHGHTVGHGEAVDHAPAECPAVQEALT